MLKGPTRPAEQSASLEALKRAFDQGYNAFLVVEKNERGYTNNPPNPYHKDGLLHKEWQRGFDRGFWEAQTKVEREQEENEAKTYSN
jgi:hypothetical protein